MRRRRNGAVVRHFSFTRSKKKEENALIAQSRPPNGLENAADART